MMVEVIARFGQCEVDFDRVEIRLAGALVRVEPQVFDVLSYLLEHRERLVTKEELLDNVWGDRFVSESALTSRIKSARRAVGDSGRAQSVIKTVHGRGYRFVADVELVSSPDQGAPAAAETADRPNLPGPTSSLPDIDPDAAPSSTGSRPEDRWPLVGRHDEIDEIDRCLADASCHGILLTGPSGIGKTRLAQRCVERAARAGLPTAQASAHADAEGVPLACLAHLLPPDVLDAVAHEGDMARAVVFQRARAALQARAGTQPLVLLVDNAFYVDELSAALIGSLVGSGTVFAVLTQRTAAGTQLAHDGLVRSGHLRHIELAALDDTDLDVLLYRALEGPIDYRSLSQLTALAQGRPGALQDLVETCRASRVLDRQEGVWRLVAPIEPTIGAPGEDPIAIFDLDPEVVAGAELLAIAGDLDLDVATELIGADALDALDRHGLLALDQPEGQPRLTLAQPHVALLLLQRLGTLRARRHKARLVRGLEGRRLDNLDELRRVRWTVEIGDTPPVAEVLAASRAAVGAADGPTAEILLAYLERNGGEMEGRQLRAELAFRRGQMDRAEQLLGQIDRTQLEARTAATVQRRRATIRFHVRGRYDEAIELLEQAESEAPSGQRAVLTTHRLALQGFMGRADRVLTERDVLDDDLDPLQRLEVLRAVAQALTLRGRLHEAVDLLDTHERESARLAPATAQPGLEVARSTAIAAHAALGDMATASELIREHLPAGRRTLLAWLPMAAARVELASGRPRAAREMLTTPLAAVQSQNLLHAEPLMTALVARAELHLGDAEAAARRADVAAEGLADLGGQLRFSLVFALAEVWIDTEQRERALEHLLPAAEEAAAIGALVTEAELSAMAALAGAADVTAERIGSLAGQIEGVLWPIVSRHVDVLADLGDPADLPSIADDYRRIGYVRLADVAARDAAISR